jgi:hypothetical protein
MKILRFNENQDTFRPLKVEDKRIYYKIHVDNSFRKFEVALDKLGIRKMVKSYYDFDDTYINNIIENNIDVYVFIDFFKNRIGQDDYEICVTSDQPGRDIEKYINGGEVFSSDYEVAANKYNL